MASLRARSLFPLENSALKFDLSGVERRSKRDIFQSRYQLGEFHHKVPVVVIFILWSHSTGLLKTSEINTSSIVQ